jgi:molecular chaperone GrpE
MESENENLSSKEENASQEPDFKSLLSQVDKLESELENERRKNAEQINRMKYLQADLINMQKQADRMVTESKTIIKMNWILEIISIKEDLDRALQSASSDTSVLIDGLKLLASRIDSDLKAEDVKAINVELDTKFDPKIHEAIATQERDDKPEGIILSVIANGYTVGGKVIKPALVEVSRKKPLPPAPKKILEDETSAATEETKVKGRKESEPNKPKEETPQDETQEM